nr:hypothetical protein [uncultured Cohaesibacter sp.]
MGLRDNATQELNEDGTKGRKYASESPKADDSFKQCNASAIAKVLLVTIVSHCCRSSDARNSLPKGSRLAKRAGTGLAAVHQHIILNASFLPFIELLCLSPRLN